MFENPFRNHNLDASPICPTSAKKYDPLSYRIFKALEDSRMVYRIRGITASQWTIQSLLDPFITAENPVVRSLTRHVHINGCSSPVFL